MTLDGVPDISDVASLIDIMTIMGAKIERKEDSLIIDPRGVKDMPMPCERSIVCVPPIISMAVY